MAIHRGIQSALFYYLSCAPCADTRYRKRRKQEAARSRAERLALDAEEFNVYRHPGEPSSTNPHWQSEIEQGPIHGRKGKKKATTGDSQSGLRAGRVSSNASNNASVAEFAPGSGSTGRVDASWNFCRGGKDSEQWCGSESFLDESMYEGSVQRPATARTVGSTSTMYHLNLHPAINEMHPPTVTRVSRREDVVWMMQPVPTARAMSTSDRATRSRSDSGGSRIYQPSTNLSRQVSTRTHETKLRAGTSSAAGMSRESSFRSTIRRDGISGHDFAMLPTNHTCSTSDSADSALRRPELAAMRHAPRRTVSRPPLSTVLSDGDLPFQIQQSSPKENNMPKPPNSVDGTADVLECHAVRAAIATSDKPIGAVFRHKHDDSEVSIRPELFDSWYTPEFELGKYIFEHTKREVHKRWSMDL